MTDPQPFATDLESFVDRAEALLEEPPTSTRETRTWLVEPFLATLGWDVRADAVVPDVDLDGTPLEYVCRVDSTPAAFVAVEAAGESLARERATDLVERMRATGVDRAIYTDGREYAFLVGREDVESTACSLATLPRHESTLRAFSAATARERLERHSRAAVARRLAVDRRAIVDAVADELVAAAGSAHRDELESAADRFLAGLLETFLADESADGTVTAPSGGATTAASTSTESANVADPAASGDASADSDSRPADEFCPGARDDRPTEAESASVETAADDRDEERVCDEANASGVDDEAGEYVVRFFDGGRSVGAIGHATSTEALVHAAEFLLERGLSGVELPWTAEDGRVVLDDRSRGGETAMAAPRELSNGYFLETAGSVRDRSRRVEALAVRAGMRAMLTGDWKNSE